MPQLKQTVRSFHHCLKKKCAFGFETEKFSSHHERKRKRKDNESMSIKEWVTEEGRFN